MPRRPPRGARGGAADRRGPSATGGSARAPRSRRSARARKQDLPSRPRRRRDSKRTTGLGAIANRRSYRAAIWLPIGVGRGRRLGVDRGDRRLELIGPGPAAARTPDQAPAGPRRSRRVPASAVLVGQQHDLTARPRARARAASRAGASAPRARATSASSGISAASSLPSRSASAHRARAQQVLAGGRGIALVEHQIDHRQYGPSRSGSAESDGTSNAIRGVADLALGADEPLGHRRLGDEERPADLGRGQARDRLERQRHPRVERERRMAAGEQHAQPLVADLGEPLPSGSSGAPAAPARRRAARPSPLPCADGGAGRSRDCARRSAAMPPARPGCRSPATVRARSRTRPGARPPPARSRPRCTSAASTAPAARGTPVRRRTRDAGRATGWRLIRAPTGALAVPARS